MRAAQLGGWWRLWIVTSAIWIIGAASSHDWLNDYADESWRIVNIPVTETVATSGKLRKAVDALLIRTSPDCLDSPRTMRVQGGSRDVYVLAVVCARKDDTLDRFWPGAWMVVSFPLLILMLVMIGRWVFAGFRLRVSRPDDAP